MKTESNIVNAINNST
jgi:hypothetical protein